MLSGSLWLAHWGERSFFFLKAFDAVFGEGRVLIVTDTEHQREPSSGSMLIEISRNHSSSSPSISATRAMVKTKGMPAIVRLPALYEGGTNWAIIASLIETCKLNAVNPHAWLADTLTKLVNRWPASRIDELMPWVYGKGAAN